jgi:hypothetical protein
MIRAQCLLLAMFLSTNASALSITCPPPESIDESMAALRSAYEQADVVFLSNNSVPGRSNTSKHTVELVWKGVVGSEPHVYGSSDYRLIFATRAVANEPLTHTGFSCGLDEADAISILFTMYGSGHLPNPEYSELPYSQMYLLWPIAIVMLALSAISMVVYNYVSTKTSESK